MKTKAEYIELFDKFAKTAIKLDGEDLYYLYGHCINIQQFENGTWDIAICNQKEYAKGHLFAFLGTGKINNICATLPDEIDVKKLDGEAYFQIPDHDINWLKTWLWDNRKKLGIKMRGKAPAHAFKSTDSSRNNTTGTPCGELT